MKFIKKLVSNEMLALETAKNNLKAVTKNKNNPKAIRKEAKYNLMQIKAKLEFGATVLNAILAKEENDA